ncbi:MAG: tetratricopeptide repeat protein [Coraliomargarita sp.]
MSHPLQIGPQAKSPRFRLILLSVSLVLGIAAGNWLLAYEASSDNVANPHVVEGYALLEAGESDSALKAFETALTENESDLSAMLGQAMIYSERQEHQEAFSAYNSIVRAFPQHAFAWNRRGLAAFNLEDFDEALDSFERATESQPVNGFFYESLAWTHMCRGEFPEAAESAKTASLMYNREGESTLYPILIAYFAYVESGDDLNARRTLAYAVKNRSNTWPSPVIEYLANRIDASDLISFVTNTAEETEARTYIGLKLKALGDTENSDRHLNWVARQGDPRVFEYTLARSLKLQSSIARLDR